MAWKFPKRKTRYDSPIDGDALSDNLHEFVSEAGKLNEHNFNGDKTVNKKNVQIPYRTNEGAAVSINNLFWTTDHRIGAKDDLHTYSYGTTSSGIMLSGHSYVPPYGPRGEEGIDTSTAKSIQNNPSWQPLKSITGTTQNSTMWIIASFCVVQTDEPYRGETEDVFDTGEFADGNFQFALRLNGSIIWETATMSAGEDGDPIANRELHGPANLTLDAIVPISAGPFTLDLVGRCTHSHDYARPQVITGDLIAIEFRR
jgi:hypothetical protein